MDGNGSVADDVCRRFVEVLATRKQPLRVVKNALARASTDAPSARARHDAFAAVSVAAVGLGVPTPYMDDDTHARAPRLPKLEALEAELMRAIGCVLSVEDELAVHACKLREHFMARFAERDRSSGPLPLFASHASSVPPAPVVEDTAYVEAELTVTGGVRAACAYVTGPLDDAEAVES